MKSEGGERLMQAIRQVLAGQIYVSGPMSSRILENLTGQRPNTVRSPIERLTEREFQVLQLLGQGHGSREIADKLRLSIKTVEVHRVNIKRKLELKTATELVRTAVRWVDNH
jgi:DNA-binding NarL/FixJ family response regulator